jgi:hypothetical protein
VFSWVEYCLSWALLRQEAITVDTVYYITREILHNHGDANLRLKKNNIATLKNDNRLKRRVVLSLK